MEINGVNGSNSTSSSTRNRFEELTSEDFMKIMFTELTNQDPLEPQDSQALLEQINTLRSIESSTQLMDQLSQLVQQNQFSVAGTMVGKSIVGLDENFYPVRGRVQAASLEGDRIVLTLENGERVPFDNVETVFEDDAADATT